MKRQKENSHENITWSEMGKQNVQAEEVYCGCFFAEIAQLDHPEYIWFKLIFITKKEKYLYMMTINGKAGM